MVTRTGRIFNPYLPWMERYTSEDLGNEDQVTIDALFTNLSLNNEIQRACSHPSSYELDEFEGTDLSPPPSPFVAFFSDSPLSTPPHSPLSSPPCSPLSSPPQSPMMAPMSLGASLSQFTPRAPGTGSQSTRAKKGKAARQARKRLLAKDGLLTNGFKPRSSLSKKWRLPTIIRCAHSIRKFAMAHGAYVGLPYDTSKEMMCPTPEELDAQGFRRIQWDGTSTKVLVDMDNHIVVTLAGRPSGQEWEEMITNAGRMMTRVEEEFYRRRVGLSHRRGHYAHLGTGVSFGGGQTFPSNLQNHAWKQKLIDKLLNSTEYCRIAGFQNGTCFVFF